MRYGIISDIHGNLQAFEAVISQLKKEKVDAFLCAGDVVGYGANPGECIELLEDLKIPCVAGNHDWAVTGKTDTAYFNDLARESIRWTQKYLPPEGMNFLNRLELIYASPDLMLVHGLLPHPERFDYLTETDQASAMFPCLDRQICFVGHTHVPQIFIQDKNGVFESGELNIRIEDGKKYIVNVGSVGQPRDGDSQAAYCVYDSESKTAAIKRTPYAVEEAQKMIVQAGLSFFLAQRLSMGR